MHWWERWPGLLQRELSAYADAGLDARIDAEERRAGRLVIHTAVEQAGRHLPLTVVYPDSFPNTRPQVYGDEPLPRHRHPGSGQLCVAGRDPEQWTATLTGASLVLRVPELFQLVGEGGAALAAAEDPQGEPYSLYYEYVPNGAIIMCETVSGLPPGVSSGTFTLAFNAGTAWIEAALVGPIPVGVIGQGLVASVFDEAGAEVAASPDQIREVFGADEIKGRWVRLPRGAVVASTAPEGVYDELLALDPRLAQGPKTRVGPGEIRFLGFVFDEEVRQGEYEPCWVLVAVLEPALNRAQRRKRGDLTGGPTARRVALLRGLRYANEDLMCRVPELRSLRAKKVGVVGLGSLGGPLTIEFARNQVGHLHIADRDHAEPGASVRWVDGMPAAGVHKAFYLAPRIRRHYPLVQVAPENLNVGDAPRERPTTSEAEILDRILEHTDLLIDATADDNASRALADVAARAEVTLISLWGVDGYGGVVARFRPNGPCFHCLSLHLADGGIKPPPAADHPVRVQGRGCAEATFLAPGTDLAPLRDMAARLAFSTLCEGEGDGYPGLADDAFVLSLRRSDGALEPVPVWNSHPLVVHPLCPRCTRDQQAQAG